jgi:hypothetical protein
MTIPGTSAEVVAIALSEPIPLISLLTCLARSRDVIIRTGIGRLSLLIFVEFVLFYSIPADIG